MKTQLTDSEKADLIPKIEAVLNGGEPWEDLSLHHSVEAIVNAILDINGVKCAKLEGGQYGKDGFDTNGWQWDWWQTFEYKGKRYTLSGSGYYGGHSFHPADE